MPRRQYFLNFDLCGGETSVSLCERDENGRDISAGTPEEFLEALEAEGGTFTVSLFCGGRVWRGELEAALSSDLVRVSRLSSRDDTAVRGE